MIAAADSIVSANRCTVRAIRTAIDLDLPQEAGRMAAARVSSYRQTAAIRARNAGSKIGEAIANARTPLTEIQLRHAVECAFNMTRKAVEFARVAIDARTPKPATLAYTCVDCKRQQDIDGNCIVCGLPVVASEVAA